MLLFTDLDNTVVYSHRHRHSAPVVWVETLNGKRQSYVTRRAYRFYESQNWLDVVPVTTRTAPQYARLRGLCTHFGWQDALICNGAVLLREGVEDSAWTEESRRLSQPDRAFFERAYELAAREAGADSIVLAEPFLFYVKTDAVDRIFTALSEQTDRVHLSVLKDSRKVYCMPISLNKGCAVKRYLTRFGHQRSIAAGDSKFDLPMLRGADYCLYPEGIREFPATGKKMPCGGVFSDAICDGLEKLRKEE